jgi:hypothetical protein
MGKRMFKRCGGRCSGISTTAVQLHKDVQMKGAKTTNKRNGQRDSQAAVWQNNCMTRFSHVKMKEASSTRRQR